MNIEQIKIPDEDVDRTISRSISSKNEFMLDMVTNKYILSNNILRKWKDKLNWQDICCQQVLSEETIREFKDYVNWDCVGIHQTLSEELMREFIDKFNWQNISAFQYMSEKFIEEYANEINWPLISSNYRAQLSERLMERFIEKIDWKSLFKFTKREISKEFFDRHKKDYFKDILWIDYHEYYPHFKGRR